MSIKTKMIFALSILVALMGSQIVISIGQINRLASIANTLTDYSSRRATRIADISTSLTELRSLELAVLFPGQGTTINNVKEAARTRSSFLIAQLKTALADYGSFKPSSGANSFLGQLETNLNQYLQNHSTVLELAVSGAREQALDRFLTSQGDFSELLSILTRVQLEDSLAAQNAGQLAGVITFQTRHVFTVALVIAGLLELLLAWYLGQSITGGLNALLAGTRRVTAGNLSQEVSISTQDEFAHLARSFNAMMRSLEQARAENSLLNQQALDMREKRISTLHEHLSLVVKAQEDERQRVARELHDQAGQALTALQYGLGRLEKLAESDQLKEEAANLRKLTLGTMQEIRNLAFDLRPSLLDDLGIVPALREYGKEYSRRVGLPVQLNLPGLKKRPDPEVETMLFRVAQEALTNIAKHAEAKRVELGLQVEDGQLLLVVLDDGGGFDISSALTAKRKSLGLTGMQERVTLLGGDLQISSITGSGTSVTVKVPFSTAASSLEEKL